MTEVATKPELFSLPELERQIAAQLCKVPELGSPDVPSEEMARRIAEFQHAGYHGAQRICPWPGCGFVIPGIDFQLERTKDLEYRRQLMFAWYQGPGFAGRCPGCRKYVLFRLLVKECVDDPVSAGFAVLPDDWYQKAFVHG